MLHANSINVKPKQHKISNNSKIRIAYYTPMLGNRIDSSSTEKIFNQNFKKVCEMIDPEDFSMANIVIVSMPDLKRLPERDYRTHRKEQLWLFYTEESPHNTYKYYVKNNPKQLFNTTIFDDWFNLTSTLKPESDFHIQYKGYRIKQEIVVLLKDKLNYSLPSLVSNESSLTVNLSLSNLTILSNVLISEIYARQDALKSNCPHGCNRQLSEQIYERLQKYLPSLDYTTEKTKLIAWFVSNCNTHSRREEYVNELKKHVPVDIYGDCSWHLKRRYECTKWINKPENCTKKLLKQYKFYLSFENSQCDTYITEKFWSHGLGYNGQIAIVPIVSGAKKEQYEKISINNSFIHVDDFKTSKELANYLLYLDKNNTAYNKYLAWKSVYDIEDHYSPTRDMHSSVCLLGHYQRLHDQQTRNAQEHNQYLMNKIKRIFSIDEINLKNFNWETSKTNLIRISQFYSIKTCWDIGYPNLLQRFYNFFFTWN
ncbi:unnamed protein product [Didymodactylos carnosus]|uniref:Fucosyltransferase n=1 Tax=Didymodactylos carnosus TaxID=1234261 RepID=A0A815TP82_9BILA|nr:unnamed protein product [Didymodactylos carnosus]CAF1504801.1 unnamed protein product [Didymodactylos carnosus]CAF3717818.1 unnamed protein product [Didymodactylos carnosus]CAF4366138.1 unnamed protein product [Didymodactylos carnosus]